MSMRSANVKPRLVVLIIGPTMPSCWWIVDVLDIRIIFPRIQFLHLRLLRYTPACCGGRFEVCRGCAALLAFGGRGIRTRRRRLGLLLLLLGKHGLDAVLAVLDWLYECRRLGAYLADFLRYLVAVPQSQSVSTPPRSTA